MLNQNLKSLLFSVATVSSRLVSSSIIFILLARWMDRSDFSALVYFTSISLLTSLIIDFGLGIKFARDGALKNGKRKASFEELLGLKVALCLPYILFIVLAITMHPSDELAFLLVAISVLVQSFIEFTTVYFRLLKKFQFETSLALFNAILSLMFIYAGKEIDSYNMILVVPCALIISRTIVLIVAINKILKLDGFFKIRIPSYRKAKSSVNSSIPYFIDRMLTIIYSNGDILIIKHMIGLNQLAPYQSGIKLTNAFLSGATAIGNVYLPKIVSNLEEDDKKAIRNDLLLIISLGAFLAFMILQFSNKYVSEFIFKNKFQELEAILPYFAYYVYLRFFAAYFGLLLTAHGLQKQRLMGNIIALLSLFILSISLVGELDLIGIIISLIISTLVLIILFSYFLKRARIETNSSYVFGLVGIIILFFICQKYL